MRSNTCIAKALTATLTLVYLGCLTRYGLTFEDEGTLLAQIARFADGESLYTDFHIGYTPGVYWLNGLLMKAFDGSLIPIRWVLAFTTTAAAVLLYSLSYEISRRAWFSLLSPLLYVAAIPVYLGRFAAGNIPYPVWYSVALWAAGLLCLLRFARGARLAWLFAAGLLAGVGFSFKPNVGLFQLAVSSMVVLSVCPLQAVGRPSWKVRLGTVCWWLWWFSVFGGLGLVFSGRAGPREVWILCAPFLACGLLVAWRAAVVPPTEPVAGLYSSAVTLGLGFAVSVAPWLVYFYDLLGPQLFVQRVLFFGANFEQFYFIAHPLVLTAFATLGATLLVVWWLPRRVAHYLPPGRVLLVLAVVAVPVGAAMITNRPMPEGFYAAVMSEFEAHAYALALVAHWIGIWAWSRSIGTTPRHRDPSLVLTVTTLGAVGLYMQIYPRTDYMHWVTAAPVSIALGVGMLPWLADRWTWGDGTVVRRAVTFVIAVPFLIIGFLRVGHGMSAAFDLHDGRIAMTDRIHLDNPRAPVWVNAGAAQSYDELSGLLRFLDESTVPVERLFTFPSLEVVSYLSGRPNPTRHGYFYPGWPGREVETEVVADLQIRPPRFAVVLHWHPLFFARASMYYYQLGNFLDTNYRPYARFGRYVVLANRDAVPEGSGPWTFRKPLSELVGSERFGDLISEASHADATMRLAAVKSLEGYHVESEIGPLTDALKDQDMRVRDRAVWAYRDARDPTVARALIRGVSEGRFSDREAELALRITASSADMTAAADVLGLMDSHDTSLVAHARTLLLTMASREFYASFWQGRLVPADLPLSAVDDAARSKLEEWVGPTSGAHYAERYFAMLSAPPRSDGGCPSKLAESVGTGTLSIRLIAMWRLLHCSAEHDNLILLNAVRALAFDDVLAPRIVLKLVARSDNPDKRMSSLVAGVQDNQRVPVLWIASEIGGNLTAETIIQLIGHGDPMVRFASAWALANTGRDRHLPHIESLLQDEDATVVEMAGRALKVIRKRMAR